MPTTMTTKRIYLAILLLPLENFTSSFSTEHRATFLIKTRAQKRNRQNALLPLLAASGDAEGSEEGSDLAAEFFQNLKGRDMGEEEEEDSTRNIPVSEINVFSGRDEGGVGKLAGNVTFTNKELYDSLKERCLESPASFGKLVGDEEDEPLSGGEYKVVDSRPNPELTTGEVVTAVLDALNHKDIPEVNHGIRVLFGYSSPRSILGSEKAPTVEEYADFLETTEYRVLLDHKQVIIDKATYAYDGKKAFYTVRLRTGSGRSFTSANIILSTNGKDEDDCWLIDSILIRDEGMGRRRR